MKIIQFTFISMMILGLGFTSCKKSATNRVDPTPTMPDASVSVTVSGALDQQFSYNLPKQGGNDGAANGGYSSADNYLTFVFLASNTSKISGEKSFGFTASAESLAKGTYILNDGAYVDVGITGYGKFISGSVKINKVDKYMDTAGGTSIHWVSGSADYVLQDGNTPPRQITVKCDFSNIYTAKQ